MKQLICFLSVLCLLFVLAGPSHADTFVKLSGRVQDFQTVTPLEDLSDTILVSVQVGTMVSEITSASVLLQTINTGDVLAGVQVDFAVPLNIAESVKPYVGFATSINVKDVTDDGVILSALAGIEVSIGTQFGVFAEARSLTWYTGEGDSRVGVGIGLMFSF